MRQREDVSSLNLVIDSCDYLWPSGEIRNVLVQYRTLACGKESGGRVRKRIDILILDESGHVRPSPATLRQDHGSTGDDLPAGRSCCGWNLTLLAFDHSPRRQMHFMQRPKRAQ